MNFETYECNRCGITLRCSGCPQCSKCGKLMTPRPSVDEIMREMRDTRQIHITESLPAEEAERLKAMLDLEDHNG